MKVNNNKKNEGKINCANNGADITSKMKSRTNANNSKTTVASNAKGIPRNGTDLNRPSIESKIESITSQLATLTESYEFLSGKYDDAINEIKSITQTNNQLQKSNELLSKKYNELLADVNGLKQTANVVEQQKVGVNVLIRNLKPEENAKEAIVKIAELSEHQMVEGDIVSAEQVTSAKNEPVIIAKFRNNDAKMGFIKAAKKKKISTQMFGYNDTPKPVYVDEQLTRATFMLFKRAKELKKVGAKFVWISNGEILTRQADKSPVVRIISEAQIVEIENQLLLQQNRQNEAQAGIADNARAVTDTQTSSGSNQLPQRTGLTLRSAAKKKELNKCLGKP